jgi:outer membrane lipoprotein SlyB
MTMATPNTAGFLTVILLALALTACSSKPRTPGGVIIDKRGIDMQQYAADLDECGAYADEVRAGEKVAAHSAGGAVVGGAVGSIYRHSDAEEGAAAGAVVGAVRGVERVSAERSLVVKNCMRQRGYIVLN